MKPHPSQSDNSALGTQLDLDLWNYQVFFETDRMSDNHNPTQESGPSGSRSRSASAALPTSTSTASYRDENPRGSLPAGTPFMPGNVNIPDPIPQGMPPEAFNYLINALLSMQNSLPQGQPGLQLLQNYLAAGQGGFPNQSLPAQSPSAAWHYPPSISIPPLPYNNLPQLFPASYNSHSLSNLSHYPPRSSPPLSPGYLPSSLNAATPASGSASQPTSPLDNETDQMDESLLTAEDKRRRNTAASARFRIKKKQRSLNLERTVSDLTGRAEELEREATELRRENGWLKEIVLLKGRSLRGGEVRADASAGNTEMHEGDQGSDSSSEEDEDGGDRGKGKGKEKSTSD